eukprot:CAMPEP_0185575490 /NCGR_PEP_ID=MMETSP0434-20130131/6668_1 /TAXON_ID=626734 ORGANISM="Favella taraikaensis, Strain Fe Narragansett Bay" /NCGR_SAMPLE_ID=MMETSP0434 /ASSEMBLY_ACC=CAM_ASM_000379 /LENGTH=185 /DNA_ID=CAMNT_0028192379 /DNA_START=1981 /DNA_END=2538 /DNA_ORIENTATION=+
MEFAKLRKPHSKRNFVAVATRSNRMKKEDLLFIKEGFEAHANTIVNQSLRGSKKSNLQQKGTKSSIANITHSSATAYHFKAGDGAATPLDHPGRSKTTHQRLQTDGIAPDSSIATEYQRINTESDDVRFQPKHVPLPKSLRRKNSGTPKKVVPVKYSPTRDMVKQASKFLLYLPKIKLVKKNKHH